MRYFTAASVFLWFHREHHHKAASRQFFISLWGGTPATVGGRGVLRVWADLPSRPLCKVPSTKRFCYSDLIQQMLTNTNQFGLLWGAACRTLEAGICMYKYIQHIYIGTWIYMYMSLFVVAFHNFTNRTTIKWQRRDSSNNAGGGESRMCGLTFTSRPLRKLLNSSPFW